MKSKLFSVVLILSLVFSSLCLAAARNAIDEKLDIVESYTVKLEDLAKRTAVGNDMEKEANAILLELDAAERKFTDQQKRKSYPAPSKAQKEREERLIESLSNSFAAIIEKKEGRKTP